MIELKEIVKVINIEDYKELKANTKVDTKVNIFLKIAAIISGMIVFLSGIFILIILIKSEFNININKIFYPFAVFTISLVSFTVLFDKYIKN